MLVNRSSMIVAKWGSGRMTYGKKKPFAAQDLRVTLQRTGNKIKDKKSQLYIDTVVNFMKNVSGILFR